ncbi:MAG: cysteine desulfurase [Clostridia bacterium]|nr:cysteine desulfurase [Clostridia bacterium]
MKTVYLDNASTTPLSPEVLSEMEPYLTGIYGNANSSHSLGRLAMAGLDLAREKVASLLSSEFNEIYFTSGGTESNNFALRGAFDARDNKNALVISSIEHPSVLQTANVLEKKGALVYKVKPSVDGVVSVNDYKSEWLKNAFLTACMAVNNEIGSIEPIKELAEKAHENGSLFFTDAVQGYALKNLNVKDLGVDMLSLSAHKFGGPKGVGIIYIKNGVKIAPQLTGGHQERTRRSGTSNVAGAVGLAKALELTRSNLDKDNLYVKTLRDNFVSRALEIKGVSVNGKNVICSNANLLFSGFSGEAILNNLDMKGVCASLGSACTAGTLEPSHVLKEIGLSEKDALSSIRFTFSKNNTQSDVDYAVETLKEVVKNLAK